MKAHIEPVGPSITLQRICDALVAYKPDSIEIVPDRTVADLVVLHVNGRRDKYMRLAKWHVEQGQKVAVIQYCVRSTQKSSTADWIGLWDMASVVWSYLDLPSLVAEDKQAFEFEEFYYSPLGVSKAFVHAQPTTERPYLIGTSGTWLSESVREVIIAARGGGGCVFHLGEEIKRPGVVCKHGMDDTELAGLWASCEYVSGLRRTEGFELPAAEGLVCGARPVLFDRDHYRHWYGDLADYIPEYERHGIIRALEALFRGKRRPVMEAERREGARRFDWGPIITSFWDRCL